MTIPRMATSLSSSYNNPCAACKFLRRKCVPDCMFAPYFPPEHPQKFSCVHRVFGASNVSKILQDLPPHRRGDAANSLVYEAEFRLHDHVYGCVGYVSNLNQNLQQIHHNLILAKNELSLYLGNNNNINIQNTIIGGAVGTSTGVGMGQHLPELIQQQQQQGGQIEQQQQQPLNNLPM
ncbi:LOB domain-containing protein 6 [Acorus gramineus]|uniref:LOB domain-containing protein 6 n=1 Tax=Acorus gramineus TaxID=55184 RepID=A0AAV9AIP4_ACOGR|nr:LOB domain-containing protein 6 [Acorus gramineus]